jgi:hypothetical protein
MLKGSMHDEDQFNATASSKALVSVPEDVEEDLEEDVDEYIEAFDSEGEAENSEDYSYR